MKNLTQEEWKDLLVQTSNSIVLDVRTDLELADGKIPGAINLDIYQAQHFVSELDNMDKSIHYFVYCKSGGRSAQACAVMQQMGFEHTFNLEGGFSNWSGDIEL